MVFAILYGFNCGCFISLTPAVAARLYGPSRLAGLSGMLFMFNMPGQLRVIPVVFHRLTRDTDLNAYIVGNGAGAPVSGALLNATGHDWRAVACIMGGLQVLGAIFLLYGMHHFSIRHTLIPNSLLLDAARFKRESKVIAVF